MLHCLKLSDIPGGGISVMMLKTQYRKKEEDIPRELGGWIG